MKRTLNHTLLLKSIFRVMVPVILVIFLSGCAFQGPARHNTIYRGPYPVEFQYPKERKAVCTCKMDNIYFISG